MDCQAPTPAAAVALYALHRTCWPPSPGAPDHTAPRFLAHVAFRQRVQQIAGELITSGVVHAKRSHFGHVEILRRLHHGRTHLVGTVTGIRESAFRQRVGQQNFRRARRVACWSSSFSRSSAWPAGQSRNAVKPECRCGLLPARSAG